MELIRAWSRDIGHVVDTANSPKAEFARLAKAKGWEGGNETWRSRWKECFKEEYPYGQCRKSSHFTMYLNRSIQCYLISYMKCVADL